MPPLKVATFNVNNINTHLANVLEWLGRESPDVVCLQELKATDEQFPALALQKAGYEAVWHGERLWNGVAILARGIKPVERRRTLPGQEADSMSRYIEADVGGLIVGCLYLPNGNPRTGPKFQYKLAWFDCLIAHAATLFSSKQPVVLAGDYNVVPTDEDIYDPKSWCAMRSCSPRAASGGSGCSRRAGSMRSGRSTPGASTRSGISSASTGSATRACASTISCSMKRSRRRCSMPASTAGCAGRPGRAITHRSGSRSASASVETGLGAVLAIHDEHAVPVVRNPRTDRS